jgi:membrane protease YdiL (CAAX protease family)
MIEVPPTASVPSIPLGGVATGRWSVVGAVVFTAVVLGTAMVAGNLLHYGYLAWRLGADAALEGNAMSELAVDEQRALFAGAQLGAQVVQLALILWLARLWHTQWRPALCLTPPHHGSGGFLKAVALLFGVKILATIIAAGFSPAPPRSEMAPFLEVVSTPLAWWLFLATVTLAGATEELVFRGVLSRTLEGTSLGFWGGAALTSLGFAALHTQYGLGGQAVIFAIGLTLAWIRMRSGSIWPPIVCHAVNNAVALLAMRAMV